MAQNEPESTALFKPGPNWHKTRNRRKKRDTWTGKSCATTRGNGENV